MNREAHFAKFISNIYLRDDLTQVDGLKKLYVYRVHLFVEKRGKRRERKEKRYFSR